MSEQNQTSNVGHNENLKTFLYVWYTRVKKIVYSVMVWQTKAEPTQDCSIPYMYIISFYIYTIVIINKPNSN